MLARTPPSTTQLLATFSLALFGSVWLLAGLLTRGGGLASDWLGLAWQWLTLPTAAAGLALLTESLLLAAGWDAPAKSADRHAAWFLAGAIWLAYAILVYAAQV